MRLKKAIEVIYLNQIRDEIGFKGWCYDCDGNDYSIRVRINGKDRDVEIKRENREDITAASSTAVMTKRPGFSARIPLNGEPFHKIEIFVDIDGQSESILSKTKAGLRKWTVKKHLLYNIDSKFFRGKVIHVQGWAATASEVRPAITVEKESGEPVEFTVSNMNRMDVVLAKGLSKVHGTCGFHIRFAAPDDGNYVLCIDDGQTVIRVPLKHFLIKVESYLIRIGVMRAKAYLQRKGIKATIFKIIAKILRLDTAQYGAWYKKACFSKQQLEKQRNTRFDYEPLISFAVPLYQTPEKYLKEMIESIQAQTYSNWELCLADGSGAGKSCEKIVKAYADADPRIHYVDLGENKGIPGNTNAALELAKGDYIALVDHDDLLAPEAAYLIVKAINDDREIDVVYTDEDKVDMSGKKHFEPNFKPDFSPDMLRSVNYICHLFVMKKSILEKVGGFREEYNGAQDYDMIFRATEAAGKIRHIPRVLYHWRCHMDSTALDPESKMYAFEAGIRAINAHLERMGLPAHAEHGEKYGMYRIRYQWPEQPLVSVLIPNKDHAEDLDVVINSLNKVATYKNMEIIVIENNSTEAATWTYYEMIQKKYDNVKVVTWEGGGKFNYSAINNYGAKYAKGEYLLLLNNDVDLINPDTIQELLAFAMRDDVGAVGAKLYYRDDTIQHAGVVVGLGSAAGHAFLGFADYDTCYMGRDMYAQNYSAVTGACLMVKKSKFEEVGGLDEELAVAFNDVDFCLKLCAAGYRNVYTPYATLYHYESKSRGYEDTPEKQARFAGEIGQLQDRWADIIREGDPYYSPNLTLSKEDFSLRNLYND